jgi:TonB family protein
VSKFTAIFSISIASLALAACATGGLTSDRDSAPSARPNLRLDSVPAVGADLIFPKAVTTDIVNANRVQHQVRARLGERATAELDLCVSPQGNVTKVALARSSSLTAFDDAILRDAEEWKFEAMPGPATAQSCTRAIVAYTPHR